MISHLLKSVLILTLFMSSANAQITLVNTYMNEYVVPFKVEENEHKLCTTNLDKAKSEIKVYNSDNTYDLSIPLNKIGKFNSVGVLHLSRNVVTTDNKLSALIYIVDSNNSKYALIDEGGKILWEKEGTSGIFNIQGKPYIINYENIGGSIPTYVTRIYSLPGKALSILKTYETAGEEISAFPNPITIGHTISINLPEIGGSKTLNLYGANGQLIDSRDINDNASVINYDSKQLGAGMYYYQITGNTKQYRGQFLVQ